MSFATFRLKSLATAVGLAVVSLSATATVPDSALVANDASPVIGHAASLLRGESYAGQVAFSQPMHIEIALKLRNTDELHTFIHAAQEGYAPLAQRAMAPAQFMQRHAPTGDQAQAVAAFLNRSGFTNVTIAPNNMLVSADASADTVQTAFRTSFAQARGQDGRVSYLNTSDVHIPAVLQDSVLSVIGLQDVHRAHLLAHVVPAASPAGVVHNPTDFASIYSATTVKTAAGVTVGIISQGSLTQTLKDLKTFTAQNGLPTATTQSITINGSSRDTSGTGEWDLDSQDIIGAGGGQVGKLVFYNIPTLSDANLTAGYNRAVSDNQAKIINVSIGGCETSSQQDGSAVADDQVFQQAVAQGQTFSISTGDSGADECGDGGTTPSWPAASQFVVAVAGTRLDTIGTTTWGSEVVWNDLNSSVPGASGGSESNFEPQPSWQKGLFSGTHRGVADVAFDASFFTGSTPIVDGSPEQIGGTSLAAPIFSGLWARVIATKGTGIGFAAPLLYQLPAADFHDITSGNNGGESAAPGYDLASGRGSLILSSAINDL